MDAYDTYLAIAFVGETSVLALNSGGATSLMLFHLSKRAILVLATPRVTACARVTVTATQMMNSMRRNWEDLRRTSRWLLHADVLQLRRHPA